MYYTENDETGVVGYARIITDQGGKTIHIGDICCPDFSMQNYVNDYTEMFDDICSEVDSLVLVTFSAWSEKYWTDCGWEYDGGLNPIDVIVLQSNYKEFRKKQLLKYKKLYKPEEDMSDELKEMIELYEEIYDEDLEAVEQ